MHDESQASRSFIEGLDPVMNETPQAPEWETLRRESESRPGGIGQWWMAPAAAMVVILVGIGAVLLAGGVADTDEATPGGLGDQSEAGEVADSIEGRWILDSWEENGERVMVEEGVNAAGRPWIEFTQTFDGVRDSFISADGRGTAGTFRGSTGCNDVNPAAYEYSAGFLVLEEASVSAVGCEPERTEQVLLAMLWNTSDGIEVAMRGDRMEWYGSNLEGKVYPLVFRRDGTPAGEPASGSSTPAPPVGETPVMQVYDVGGVEVVTPTRMEELPERATRVEFTTTVIDSGDGPELCAGGVADSLPPQCSGPIAEGLDMGGWSEELNGVRWGDRTVVVTWPPVDGAVEVLDDSEPVWWDLEYPPGALPPECENVDMKAGAGPVNDYARSLGDRNGGLYLANDGTLVLQVVGDPGPHREALAELGGACVVEVSRSEAEQRRIQDALSSLFGVDGEPIRAVASSNGPGGRVEVQVAVADAATARAVADLVDDPTAIRVVGLGVLDG